jgi:hypothetical protein
MMNNGLLEVTRCVIGAHGGRGGRVFASMAKRQNHNEPWPQVDPVVAAAIDAIARHR